MTQKISINKEKKSQTATAHDHELEHVDDNETGEKKPEQPDMVRSGLAQDFLPEYLEILERPPSSSARFFSVAIIVLCFGTVLWACLARIDVIASASGRLIVDDRSKVIQASILGEVTAIHVRDGQRVSKGDVIMELQPTHAVAEKVRLANQVTVWRSEVARFKALLTRNPLAEFVAPEGILTEQVQNLRQRLSADVRLYDSEEKALESAIEQNRTRQISIQLVIAKSRELLRILQQQKTSRKSLVAQNFYSKLDYLELQRRVVEAERLLARDQATLAELVEQETALSEQLKKFRAKWRKSILDQLTEAQNKLADISKELIKAEDEVRKRNILAPANGIVQQLTVTTLGAVVKPAQELMVIVPEEANLDAEVAVLSKDIGFIHLGDSVEVKIDSFPYTKYGTIKGRIKMISQEAIEHKQMGLVYPTRITLLERTISADDGKISLMPGMSTVAEIQTGSRRVIEYLLSPLQEYQNETLRER